jgi:signal transduction histidine kinase/DNA-binding response OmpR family regulator
MAATLKQRKIVPHSAASMTEPFQEYSALNEPVSILVVDDLPEKLVAYEAILEELGQNIVMARSGEEALKLVLQKEFAVILLDVNMPGMDGFETASLIRQRKKSAHTPIIFLTAFTDEIRMAQGYASGAVDYLPTPVVPQVLQAKVRVFIELSQMKRQAALQAEETAMRKAAEDSARRSEFILTATKRLVQSQTQIEIAQAVSQLVIPYLAEASAIWMPANEMRGVIFEGAWMDSQGQVTSASLSSLSAFPELHKVTQQVFSTGKFQIVEKLPFHDTSQDSDTVRPFANPVRLLDSVLLLPLGVKEKIKGVMVLGRYQRPSYQQGDLSLARELASRINVSLENTMLMERIQEADQRKNEFLALLAHELRNPLAPIRNALYVMRHSKDIELQEKAQETIERQLNHMVHLVDDLMDVSRITQGKIELRKQAVSLPDVLAQAVEAVEPLMKKYHHSLTLSVPETPLWLEADATRLVQVFSNLLNNAAKYTNEGGQIRCIVKADGQEVEISIIDNGTGIPSHMLPRIFELFLQIDSSIERAQGGLGIGLTLVKKLVEMHDGRITAHSQGLQQGSEFRIRLPLIEPPARQEKTAAVVEEGPAKTLRVLVVDDNEASAKTMGWMMEMLGHQVRLAHDGPTAITLANSYKPDVVLLDIGLPGMNGYEVCMALKQEPSCQNTIFIAQTGWGQKEHRDRSRQAGFDHHLVKPVDLETLKDIVTLR